MTAIHQQAYPRAGRLVRFTNAPASAGRMVCVGDMTDCIPQLPWTLLMSSAVLRVLNRRRFVQVGVARRWARDLEQKQHLAKARELNRFLDWVEEVKISQ